MDAVAITAALALAGACFGYAAHEFYRAWRQARQARQALPLLANVPLPEAGGLITWARPAGAWHAMPGNRLELADTGFYILLDLTPTNPLYGLYSPEHYAMGRGADLLGLKAWGERLAAERREFADVHTIDVRSQPWAR